MLHQKGAQARVLGQGVVPTSREHPIPQTPWARHLSQRLAESSASPSATHIARSACLVDVLPSQLVGNECGERFGRRLAPADAERVPRRIGVHLMTLVAV